MLLTWRQSEWRATCIRLLLDQELPSTGLPVERLSPGTTSQSTSDFPLPRAEFLLLSLKACILIQQQQTKLATLHCRISHSLTSHRGVFLLMQEGDTHHSKLHDSGQTADDMRGVAELHLTGRQSLRSTVLCRSLIYAEAVQKGCTSIQRQQTKLTHCRISLSFTSHHGVSHESSDHSK